MFQFVRTESLISQIWGITLTVSVESLRHNLKNDDEQALLAEQADIKRQYRAFLLELEYNINLCDSGSYEQIFNELNRIFFIHVSRLDEANQMITKMLLEHGVDYQIIAWKQLKQFLIQPIDDEENITHCIMLALIATGGASIYQKAFADVERQRRILIGPTKQKTPTPALDALVEKHVPLFSQTETKQRDSGLTYRRLALFHIYKGLDIPRDKAEAIAKKHGFNSRTSGNQLCESYNTLFRSPSQRTGFESKREIDWMIEDMSFVINLLPPDKRKQAENELQTLISKRNTPL